MTRPFEELCILDADVLIHLLKMDPSGKRIEAEHALLGRRDRPILSTIVEAEVLSFARYNKWAPYQVNELLDLLREFVRVDAGHPEIVQAYSVLYCEARRVGRYKQFRQNDLWIAATARVARAVLYTCNGKDFVWIDPEYVTIVSVV